MKLLETGRQIGKTWRNAHRLKTIVGVFARHGFEELAIKMKLEKLVSVRSRTGLEQYSVAERVRMSFEELGPTFVKLGQLLAARPDILPSHFVDEFKVLNDRVQEESFENIRQVIESELGPIETHFSWVDEKPLGSASVAQVHRAKLLNGQEVVLKVQRPGIVETINEDLGALFFLAELAEKYIPESRIYSPTVILDEFFRTLQLETNFIIEANNIRRFQGNFSENPAIKVPRVFMEVSTQRVMALEFFSGPSLNQMGQNDWRSYQGDRDHLLSTVIRSFMEMVFRDGLFHGDMHAGNLFVMPDNTIGLVDFGVVGRLNVKTQKAIANMLVAIASEDYDRLAYEYVELAPFSERTDLDLLARDLRSIIAPYYGLTLKNFNIGQLLLDTAVATSKYGLVLPSELLLFFRSLISLESVGHLIKRDFDILALALDFASEMVKHRYDKEKMGKEFSLLLRESTSLIYSLPRQIRHLMRKVNSPDYTFKLRVEEVGDLRREMERSFSLVFLGLIISGLVLGASILVSSQVEPLWLGLPVISWVGYVLASFFGFIAFIHYIRK